MMMIVVGSAYVTSTAKVFLCFSLLLTVSLQVFLLPRVRDMVFSQSTIQLFPSSLQSDTSSIGVCMRRYMYFRARDKSYEFSQNGALKKKKKKKRFFVVARVFFAPSRTTPIKGKGRKHRNKTEIS